MPAVLVERRFTGRPVAACRTRWCAACDGGPAIRPLAQSRGITTVPGPMHRVVGLLTDRGLEVRRGEWVADRHVKQVKSIRGRWVVLLKDGQQVEISRRRVAEVKRRWGSTRFS